MRADEDVELPAWMAEELRGEPVLRAARARRLRWGLRLFVGAILAIPIALLAREAPASGAFGYVFLALFTVIVGYVFVLLFGVRPGTATWIALTPTRLVTGSGGRAASLPWSAFNGELAAGPAGGSLRVGVRGRAEAEALAGAGGDPTILRVGGRDGFVGKGWSGRGRTLVEAPKVADAGVSFHGLRDPWGLGLACLAAMGRAPPGDPAGEGSVPDEVRRAWRGRVDFAVQARRGGEDRTLAFVFLLLCLAIASLVALPVWSEATSPEPDLLLVAALVGAFIAPTLAGAWANLLAVLAPPGWIAGTPEGLVAASRAERTFTPWSHFDQDVRTHTGKGLVLRRRRHPSDLLSEPVRVVYEGLEDPLAVGRLAAARIREATADVRTATSPDGAPGPLAP